MREYKFRGKRLDNGGWVYGYPMKNESYDEWYIFPPQGLTGTTGAHIDPETVGQYTEMKDRNGQEIYEGDYVSVIDEDNGLLGETLLVRSFKGCYDVVSLDGEKWIGLLYCQVKDMVVVGNRFAGAKEGGNLCR